MTRVTTATRARRVAVVLAAAATGALVGACPANAAVYRTETGLRDGIFAGPVFAGHTLVWALKPERAPNELRIQRAESGRVVTFASRPDDGEQQAELAASASHLALTELRESCDNPACGVVSPIPSVRLTIGGPIGGPLGVVQRDAADQFVVDDDLIAFENYFPGATIEVRDLDDPGVSIQKIALPAGAKWRLAGPWLGVLSQDTWTVSDRATGAVAYTMAALTLPSLAADGTTAYAAPAPADGAQRDVFVRRIADVAPRRLGRALLMELKIAGGRVLASWQTNRGRIRHFVVWDVGGERLQESTLAGNSLAPAFDGRRIAVRVNPCDDIRVLVWRVGSPPAPSQGACRLPRVAAGALRMDRRGRVSVDVRCPAPAVGGCGGGLVLREAITRTKRTLRYPHMRAGERRHFVVHYPPRTLAAVRSRRLRALALSFRESNFGDGISHYSSLRFLRRLVLARHR